MNLKFDHLKSSFQQSWHDESPREWGEPQTNLQSFARLLHLKEHPINFVRVLREIGIPQVVIIAPSASVL